MAGRFPLYTDNDLRGPLVKALIDRGWSVLRAIDIFPEKTPDPVHFEYAAAHDLVLVSNDSDMKAIAERWLEEGRRFRGLVWWPPKHYGRMTATDILEAFEELAAKDDPFSGYPIVHLKPQR